MSDIHLTGWLLLFVTLFLLPATSAAVAYWLMRRWSGKRVLCAKCRYPAAGLPSARCPECGSDLRKVGLVAHGVFIRQFTVALVFTWTLIALSAPKIMEKRIMALLPLATDSWTQALLHAPHSDAYVLVDIQIEIRTRDGWFGSWGRSSSIEWTAVFRSNDIDSSVPEVRQFGTSTTVLKNDTFGIRDFEIHYRGVPDAHCFAHWLQHTFPHADPALLEIEAEAITSLVAFWTPVEPKSGYSFTNETIAHVFRKHYGGSIASRSGPVRSAVNLMKVTVILVWLSGTMWILRWGRWRLHRIEASAAAIPGLTSTQGDRRCSADNDRTATGDAPTIYS